MYWVAGVKLAVAGVATVAAVTYGSFALYEGSWSLAQHNINHQAGLNNAQYNADVNTQQYQATYIQQADKAYLQLSEDKFNIDQAKSSGDSTAEQDAYAAANADIHIFCQDAAKLTPTSLPQLGPGEDTFFTAHC